MDLDDLHYKNLPLQLVMDRIAQLVEPSDDLEHELWPGRIEKHGPFLVIDGVRIAVRRAVWEARHPSTALPKQLYAGCEHLNCLRHISSSRHALRDTAEPVETITVKGTEFNADTSRDRIDNRSQREGDCLIFPGRKLDLQAVDGSNRNENISMRTIAWLLDRDEPKPARLTTSCGREWCINPDHLADDDNQDRSHKGPPDPFTYLASQTPHASCARELLAFQPPPGDPWRHPVGVTLTFCALTQGRDRLGQSALSPPLCDLGSPPHRQA